MRAFCEFPTSSFCPSRNKSSASSRCAGQEISVANGRGASWAALLRKPDFLPAQRELAEDLLAARANDDGWKLAESAHKKDAYDVTAYNLSMLHTRMRNFATLTNAHFIVHMWPLEAELYGDRVLDLLSHARKRFAESTVWN